MSYGGVAVQLHTFLTSALDRGERSVSRSDRKTSKKSSRYPQDGAQSRPGHGSEEKNPWPCRESNSGRPVTIKSATPFTIHVTFSADLAEGRERGGGCPWQWPVGRMTSWSERYLGLYAAALVQHSPSVPSWLLQYCFPSCNYYISEILPRAAKCPIMLGFCRTLTAGCTTDNRCSGGLAP
jgi:hypothetical protein